jgi:integrase
MRPPLIRPVVSEWELRALSEAFPPALRVLVLLAGWCGLRRGELLGLQRRDAKLSDRGIFVVRSVRPRRPGDAVYGPPKGPGRRIVRYPGHLEPELENHLNHHVGPELHSPLFAGKNDHPLGPRELSAAWRVATRRIGRPDLGLGDLRRAASWWPPPRTWPPQPLSRGASRSGA